MERKLRKVPAAQRKDLQKSSQVAREEITRLDSIVQQFLGAIRPARLQTQLENINALVRESVAFLQPEIDDRNILVEQELRAGSAAAGGRSQPDQAGVLQRHQERVPGDEDERHPAHPHRLDDAVCRSASRTPAAAFRRKT